MKELKVGLVGTGGMGKIHVKNVKEIDGVSVTAICDVNEAAAKAFCEEFSLSDSTIYTDFDAMLDAEQLDALYICLPPFAHNGQVVKAAEKGIHLFIEKPIGLNSTVAGEMVDAIEKAGVVSQLGYQMRFKQSIQKLASMIADGSAGRPTLFQGRYWCNMGDTPPAWWPNQETSGGQILEQVIHLYDLALYLFGEAESGTGIIKNLIHDDNPNYTIEDTSIGMVQFKNGACASITGSNCAPPVHFIGDYQIAFENVMLDYKSTGQPWVTPDQSTLVFADGTNETFVEDADVYQLLDADFITAIQEDRPAMAPARDGLNGIKIIEEIVKSTK